MKNQHIAVFLLFILFLFISSFQSPAPVDSDPPLPTGLETPGIGWIQNQGQYDTHIAFVWLCPTARVGVSVDGEISYYLKTIEKWIRVSEVANGVSSLSQPSGIGAKSGTIHFLKGKEDQHRINVPNFDAISLGQTWPGIQVNLRSTQQNIEKILEVAEGGDPEAINFKLEGVSEICISKDQELQMDLEEGSLYFTKPIAWQMSDGKRIPVEVDYQLKPGDDSYGFMLGDYDDRVPLYIDPLLSSGFIGGSGWDFSQVVQVGRSGKIYVGGITESPDLPTTNGSFDPYFNDTTDIFLAKFDPKLSMFESFTYIGGTGIDFLNDMVLDPRDNVYFTGQTESVDYPVTTGSYDETYNDIPGDWGLGDMIISCVNPDLDDMLYSTYLGNTKSDYAKAIDLDSKKNVFITGFSYSGIEEVGPQFHNRAAGGCVLAKLDSTLSKLLASNSVMGNNYISSRDVKIDSSDQIFVSGDTWATNLVTTPGCFANSNSGKSDAFIIRLNNNIDEILAATYIGGWQDEYANKLMTDTYNNAYLVGLTKSEDFPFTPNAYDTIFEIAGILVSDAFVSKLDSNLSSMLAATFLGGENGDGAYDLCMDKVGHIFVTGYTHSLTFPVFCNSFDPSFNGDEDAFISKFSPNLDSLLASTYIGGNKSDHSYTIDMNQGDTVYIAGYTTSVNFPATMSFDTSYNGDPSDGFVLSIDPELGQSHPCCPELVFPVVGSDNHPTTIMLEWTEQPGATGYLLSVGVDPGVFDLYQQLDVGDVTNFWLHDLPCGNTIYVWIQSYNEQGENPGCTPYWFSISDFFEDHSSMDICEGESYTWQGSSYASPGQYMVNYTAQSGCDSTYFLDLFVNPVYYDFEEAGICDGESYEWQGESLAIAGNYYKELTSIYGCDSLFELKLEVFPQYEIDTSVWICQGDVYIWEGLELSMPGIFTRTFQTIENCDSTVNLELAIYPSFVQYDTLWFCENEEIQWQDQTLYTGGDYVAEYKSVNQCDSLYYLHLQAMPSYHFDESITICAGEAIEWQGVEYDIPGEYYAYYRSIQDCDSTYQLILEQAIPDTSLIISGDSLMVTPDGQSHYQWVSCPGMEAIEGATEPVYVAEASGTYAVIVEKLDCIDTSGCYYLLHSNTFEVVSEGTVYVYPNPSQQGSFTVVLGSGSGEYEWQLIDISGKIWMEQPGNKAVFSVDTENLDPGVYFLRISGKVINQTKKIVITK